MKSPKIVLKVRKWILNGHVSSSLALCMDLYLGSFRIKRIDTHGSMTDGYYGSDAIPVLVDYTTNVLKQFRRKSIIVQVVAYDQGKKDKTKLRIITEQSMDVKLLKDYLESLKKFGVYARD